MSAPPELASRRLGLGSSTFGREIDQSAAFALLDHAVGRGLTFLDTAALYSAGGAERIVGAWLAARRPAPGAVFLATKIYPPFTAGAMEAALAASLARLGVESADLLYLHKWDETAATAEAAQTLDAFVRHGRARAIGASNFTAEQLAASCRIQQELGTVRFTFLQNNHNLAVREVDAAVRAFCAQHAIHVVTYSPLGAGFLTGKHRRGIVLGTRFDVSPGHREIYFTELGWRRLDALERVARRLEVPQTLLAQAWVMHHAGIDRVIVGGRNPAHIEQALAALAFVMPQVFAELDATRSMHAALLGLSHPHSGALLAMLENLREIRRVTLWDADPCAAQKNTVLPRSRKAAPGTADLDAALTACDFAIVCVRHDQAAALARRVVAAGKHLLAEKPVGLTSAEILAVQHAAARAGVVASVLYPRRAHPCAVALRRHAAELGPLLSLEARFLATQVRFRDPRSWLFRRRESGGGVLLWLGCHYLDLLQYVSGDDVVAVAARLATRSGERIDVEDTVALALEFHSGAIGTFHASYALAFSGAGYLNARGYDAFFALNGRAGRVVWPGIEPRLRLELPSGVREASFRLRSTDSYAGECGEKFVRQFLAAMRGKRVPPTSLGDAHRTALVIEAVETSARTGRFTRVGSGTPGRGAG